MLGKRVKSNSEAYDRGLTDEALFELYRQGHTHAFDLYYERISPKIWGFIKRRIDSTAMAEDILQEVFVKIHRSREQYDSKFPLNPWVFTIVHSVLLDALRSVGRKKELFIEANELEQKQNAQSVNLQSEHQSDARELEFIDQLKNEMNVTLTDEQQELIKLRYMKEWSFFDIATSLGLTEDNVRQKLSRAIKKLRRRLIT